MSFIRPTEIFDSSQDGENTYTNFAAEDEAGEMCFCRLGWKSPKNQPQVGVEIEIMQSTAELSRTPSKTGFVRRVQAQGGYSGGNRGGGARPAQPARSPQNAPQSGGGAPAKPVPTVGAHLAELGVLIPRCTAMFQKLFPDLSLAECVRNGRAVAIGTSIGLEKGSIQHDKTPEQIAAEVAAKKAEIEKKKAEIAREEALAAMPPPPEGMGRGPSQADIDEGIIF